MANHMAEVAEMLGIRLGEDFEVVQNTGIKLFRLKETGLYTFIVEDEQNAYWNKIPNDYSLRRLLTGELTIVKPPFRPKRNEIYWYAYWKDNLYEAGQSMWENTALDFMKLKCGNCFRTKEEAEANKYRVYKELTGREWKK